jgi:hypothetical protein
MLVTLVVLKALIAALVTRPFTTSRFSALRTGIVMSIGGEFGVALTTIPRRRAAAGAHRHPWC